MAHASTIPIDPYSIVPLNISCNNLACSVSSPTPIIASITFCIASTDVRDPSLILFFKSSIFNPKASKASWLVVDPSVKVKKNSLTISAALSLSTPVAFIASLIKLKASLPVIPKVENIGVYSTRVSIQSSDIFNPSCSPLSM